MPGTRDILTEYELEFIGGLGYGPDDVLDVRGMRQQDWRRLIRNSGKTFALGNSCTASGRHRLKTHGGHCVQCDPKRLSFQTRHSADQYVYIAGSLEARLIKIGTADDVDRRLYQARHESYGGASDWELLFYILVPRAGEVEHNAQYLLRQYAVTKSYVKDWKEQYAIELFTCGYRTARNALFSAAGDSVIGAPQQFRQCRQYNFDRSTNGEAPPLVSRI